MNYTRAVSVSRFILVILCIALVLSIAVCGVDSWGLGRGIFESGTIRLENTAQGPGEHPQYRTLAGARPRSVGPGPGLLQRGGASPVGVLRPNWT